MIDLARWPLGIMLVTGGQRWRQGWRQAGGNGNLEVGRHFHISVAEYINPICYASLRTTLEYRLRSGQRLQSLTYLSEGLGPRTASRHPWARWFRALRATSCFRSRSLSRSPAWIATRLPRSTPHGKTSLGKIWTSIKKTNNPDSVSGPRVKLVYPYFD